MTVLDRAITLLYSGQSGDKVCIYWLTGYIQSALVCRYSKTNHVFKQLNSLHFLNMVY